MARQLWLLRHAEAEPHGTRPDALRALTERGVRQAVAAGAALSRMDACFEAVLFSPKARARETAQLAAEEAGETLQELPREHPPLAGGYDGAQALDDLIGLSADARLMLVGHEPDLANVISDLTGAAVSLKKGGLAVLRLRGAACELAVLLRPLELALIAGKATAEV
jgi:phosphohistidine phosphatase